MSETRPGELRWERRDGGVWTVRCRACQLFALPPGLTSQDDELAAEALTDNGWRCIDARWHCPGCALGGVR